MDKYKSIFGKKLISVIEYYIGDKKRMAIFLEDINFEEIKKFKKTFKFDETNLVFTKEELFNGVDVFPLEFLNMKKTYNLLYGTDHLINLKIEKAHVRRQLEFEFRSKLIHLRNDYLEIENRSDLVRLLEASVDILAPIFNGLLYLKNHEEKYEDKDDFYKSLKQLYGVDFTIMKNIREKKIINVHDFVNELMKLLTKLSNIVDKINCD